ncbi:PstS family phosphate ABC transporter substrate-binding protein [Roseicyclus mahoneyensis]|uniref:Phosphate ABC transporter substrate-binding protein (PhoT family) n=1 Tax=Roseicyclus mahoneyensis TaxID=164332 RepID=A0A316GG81_9RHOB|nr:substrate-binding domain-containing protein [Roseicyclus mahoneyensis]PWK60019.1 phosphate ABC transporter substrate-binding protein (PhoT family) [Roseicyclus mahoneyensis]
MSHLKFSTAAIAVIAVCAGTSAVAQTRTNVQAAGSSTVLPYANIVAEAFGAETDFATPVVEGGGSSTGRRMLCEGVGEGTIDIANSSSLMSVTERESCMGAGVTPIEVRFGYDGIVFASDINGPSFAFEPVHWHIALAAEHFIDGALVPNTLTTWAEAAAVAQSMGVAGDLPDQQINAFIPGTNHGTREVFDENVLLAGCEQGGFFEAMLAAGVDEDTAEDACMAVRTDGRSVDIEGDYTQTLANLDSTPTGMGVFGLSFYENNTDRLQVATMSGVTPSTETISVGEYPVSRPLQFYIKQEHIGVIPGLLEFVEFFISDEIAGPGGPLSEYGLVPDPALAETQAMVAALR